MDDKQLSKGHIFRSWRWHNQFTWQIKGVGQTSIWFDLESTGTSKSGCTGFFLALRSKQLIALVWYHNNTMFWQTFTFLWYCGLTSVTGKVLPSIGKQRIICGDKSLYTSSTCGLHSCELSWRDPRSIRASIFLMYAEIILKAVPCYNSG